MGRQCPELTAPDPVQTYSLMLPFEPKSVEVEPNADILADYVQDK